jgi:hypothetical protein
MSEITALTLQDVLAHQDAVQWPELYQVEQDLQLGLAMKAILRRSTVLRNISNPLRTPNAN